MIAVIIATVTAPSAVLALYLAHLLRRDRGQLWRPGDELPGVPAGAAIRHREIRPANDTKRLAAYFR